MLQNLSDVNPVISVADSEGRFIFHFLNPATLEDPSKACVVWCPRQHRNSHFVRGVAICLREMVYYRGVLVVCDGIQCPVILSRRVHPVSQMYTYRCSALVGKEEGGCHQS